MHDYLANGEGDSSLKKALKILGVDSPQLPQSAVPVGEVDLTFSTGYVWKYEGSNGAWGLVFTPRGDAVGLINKLQGIPGVSVNRDDAS